jgi:hypothetical protein
VRLTHVWHPPCWPDYDALPLDPDAAQQQFPAKLATAAAARNGGADVGEPSSPWHQAYARRQAAASEAWAEEQQRKQGLGDGEVAAQAARLAAAQRAAQQALRGRQSTAAAADVDEFDAGLFREVAGEPRLQPVAKRTALPGPAQVHGGILLRAPRGSSTPPPRDGAAPPFGLQEASRPRLPTSHLTASPCRACSATWAGAAARPCNRRFPASPRRCRVCAHAALVLGAASRVAGGRFLCASLRPHACPILRPPFHACRRGWLGM